LVKGALKQKRNKQDFFYPVCSSLFSKIPSIRETTSSRWARESRPGAFSEALGLLDSIDPAGLSRGARSRYYLQRIELLYALGSTGQLLDEMDAYQGRWPGSPHLERLSANPPPPASVSLVGIE